MKKYCGRWMLKEELLVLDEEVMWEMDVNPLMLQSFFKFFSHFGLYLFTEIPFIAISRNWSLRKVFSLRFKF